MRITRYTDYALRLLIYLAVDGDAVASLAEIADRYAISRNHLAKVARELQQAGYIETVRGRNGGMRLARAPAAIVVGDVVRGMEPDMTLAECFRPASACVITPACGLKGVLGEALDAFLDVLDRYTLADLVEGPRREGLMRALDLSGVPVRITPGGR